MEEGDVVVGSDTSSTGSAVQFEDIKHLDPYGAEYWSARDLAPLLGYKKWQNFEVALKRAMESCRQTGNIIEDHFTATSKMIATGKGAQREIKDFYLSRTAAYLIAQNGDPSKREIAEAQAYFVIATRKTELRELAEEQAKRLELRERVSENNKKLAEAAHCPACFRVPSACSKRPAIRVFTAAWTWSRSKPSKASAPGKTSSTAWAAPNSRPMTSV